ncbi:histidine phosphatase family protein [Anaerolineales bacterium]
MSSEPFSENRLSIYLVRHGETDWNIQRRFQGISDQPLNEKGQHQAQALIPTLQGLKFDAIYSSDLLRVRQTAEIALEDHQEPQLDSRLQEINFGQFEGYSWDEIPQLYPEQWTSWLADRNGNAHGGEAIGDVVLRIQHFLDELREKHPQGKVLIFAHGGSIGVLILLALGLAPDKWWSFILSNCHIAELSLGFPVNRLVRYNFQ